MQDVLVVERLDAEAHLDEERPHRRLRQLPAPLRILQVAEQVAVRRELRHNVEDVCVDERLEEGDDVRPADRGEHADLVDRLRPLLCRHAPRVHLLYRVDLLVLRSACLVDGTKGALAEELEQLEIPHVAQARHARVRRCDAVRLAGMAPAGAEGVGAPLLSRQRQHAPARRLAIMSQVQAQRTTKRELSLDPAPGYRPRPRVAASADTNTCASTARGIARGLDAAAAGSTGCTSGAVLAQCVASWDLAAS